MLEGLLYTDALSRPLRECNEIFFKPLCSIRVQPTFRLENIRARKNGTVSVHHPGTHTHINLWRVSGSARCSRHNLSNGVEDSYTRRDLIAVEYSSGFWYYAGKTANYSEREPLRRGISVGISSQMLNLPERFFDDAGLEKMLGRRCFRPIIDRRTNQVR